MIDCVNIRKRSEAANLAFNEFCTEIDEIGRFIAKFEYEYFRICFISDE